MKTPDSTGPAAVVCGTGLIGAATVAASEPSNNAAPTLAFVGALLVALITWYATDRRQRHELDASELRLQREHAHQRELEDLQDLRTEVVAVIVAAVAIERATTQILVGLSESPDSPGAHKGLHRLWDAIEQYNTAEAGLTVRLGNDHPILDAMRQVASNNDQLTEAATLYLVERHKELLKQRRTVMAQLVDAATAAVGAKLPPP